jgi:hypothetical protein
MKSPNTKSTDELKTEVDSQLKRVEADMNAIQDRMTPGQLIDDAIFYPQGKSLNSTIDHLKSNPVGTAFLSLGTILLMEDNEHHTMEFNARAKANSVKQNIADAKATMKEEMKEKVAGIRSKVDEAKTNFASKAEEVKAKMSDLSVREEEANFTFTDQDIKEHKIADRAKELLSSAKEKTSNYATLGKEQLQNLDPLSYMALGAGLGALTGSAFPVSDKEASLLNGKIDDKLGNFTRDLENAINECSNILKDLVINDVKDYQVKLFRS